MRREEGEIGADVALKAEVGVLEKDAGAEEARTADGKLVEGSGGGGGGEEVGGGGAKGVGAARAAADAADEGGEAGGGAGEAGPVAGVCLQLRQDVEHDVVGQQREGQRRRRWGRR